MMSYCKRSYDDSFHASNEYVKTKDWMVIEMVYQGKSQGCNKT